MPRLTFLGAGGAFNAALANNSAYFLHNGTLYLMDCGETVFNRAMRADLFTKVQSVVVFLTHLHGDHCGSLGTLCLYWATVLGAPATVISPDPQVKTLLSIFGVSDKQYHLQTVYDENGVKAVPSPAHHGAMTAFSYEITVDGECFYYSGDTCVLPPDLLSGLKTGRIAHAYIEAADMQGQAANRIHLSLDSLIGVIPEALRSRCTLMHLNRDYSARVKALGFHCATDDL